MWMCFLLGLWYHSIWSSSEKMDCREEFRSAWDPLIRPTTAVVGTPMSAV